MYFLEHVLSFHVLLWLFVGSVTVDPAVASRDRWVLFESLWKTPASCQNQLAGEESLPWGNTAQGRAGHFVH